jgi:hypothetical protein
MRHQSKDDALPSPANDFRSRKINVEFLAPAIGVPLVLRQSKWSNLIAVTGGRDARSKLGDTQQVVRFDSENDSLPNAFLGEHRAINFHGRLQP